MTKNNLLSSDPRRRVLRVLLEHRLHGAPEAERLRIYSCRLDAGRTASVGGMCERGDARGRRARLFVREARE